MFNYRMQLSARIEGTRSLVLVFGLSMPLLGGASCITGSGSGEALRTIDTIHGGAGPWVVAGYKMGDYAMHALGVPRGSPDIAIVHFSPAQVQYACVIDGVAAATGASLGKLNLGRTEVPLAEMRTTYQRRSNGREITLRVRNSFAERYRDVPREQLNERGREVLTLPNEDVFEFVH